jgi:uncharacterized repeat protein (TIGR01451 family)
VTRCHAHKIAAALAVLFLLSRAAFGAGTLAGTTLTNQTIVNFTLVGDLTMSTVSSNVVSVTVAQVAALNMAPATETQSTRINTIVDYPFSLVNAGNGPDRFTFTILSSLGLSAQIYRDLNADGVLSPAELAVGPIGSTVLLQADSVASYLARLVVPNDGTLVGQTDALTVTAASAFDPTKRASIYRSTALTAAFVELRKSVNNPIPRAGDRVTYTITFANTGNAGATNVTITDVLDLRLRYATGTAAPVPDSTAGQTLNWRIGSLAPGATGSITFQVDVVSNTLAGAEIHNVASGVYNDGSNVRTVSSIEGNFVTIQSSSLVTVDISPNRAATGEPGDTVAYAFVITNTGAAPEAFNLSVTSTVGVQWTLYNDSTARPQGTPITGTGTLGAGQHYALVAMAVLPVVTIDQLVDYTSFRVQSAVTPGNVTTATGSTTINVPVMSMVKTASAPDPHTGAEITYVISYANTGHGSAFALAISDSIPANTAYVAGSTIVNGIPNTDARDSDAAEANGRSVTVTVGTIEPNTHGTIAFRVRIL